MANAFPDIPNEYTPQHLLFRKRLCHDYSYWIWFLPQSSWDSVREFDSSSSYKETDTYWEEKREFMVNMGSCNWRSSRTFSSKSRDHGWLQQAWHFHVHREGGIYICFAVKPSHVCTRERSTRLLDTFRFRWFPDCCERVLPVHSFQHSFVPPHLQIFSSRGLAVWTAHKSRDRVLLAFHHTSQRRPTILARLPRHSCPLLSLHRPKVSKWVYV